MATDLVAYAIYKDRESFEAALEALRTAGFRNSDISAIIPERDRTYRHQRSKNSVPYQNDFVFARGVQVVRCAALDEERHWEHSDHCPILIELNEL